MLNTTNTEFSSVKVWFNDRNSKELEINGDVAKTAEVTGDLTGNKIADKITSVGKTNSKEKKNARHLETTRCKVIYSVKPIVYLSCYLK